MAEIVESRRMPSLAEAIAAFLIAGFALYVNIVAGIWVIQNWRW